MDSSYDKKQDYSMGNDSSGDYNKMQQSDYNPPKKDEQSGYNPPNKDMQSGYDKGNDKSQGDYQMGNDYKGGDMNKGGDNGGDVNVKVNVNIKIISIYAGGNNAVQQVAPPAMNGGQTHEVIVGGDAKKLLYTPSTLMAAAGDMVKFTFMANNHTVTQSTFPKPCVKMAGGVDSGFMPNVNNTVNPPPNYMFQVLDTNPVCKSQPQSLFIDLCRC
ncbi:MAG: hypothetical protein Q9167_007994 [Letrouitia subvulpina]